MTVTLTFPQPAPRLSMNDRRHWASRANVTKLWRDATFSAAVVQVHHGHLANITHLPPSFMRVTFPVRDNRRRDSDNPAPTCKSILDGLVDAGVFPDDTPEWVETLGSRFAKGADVVVVELIPREEGP
jgi:crossover junction endodeoxyribonuclease RusA